MENPPIRILQRPCAVSPNKSESFRPPATAKTLEQREADYAAARRRIMGSDCPHPDGEVQSLKENNKNTTAGAGQSECPISRQLLASSLNVTTAATPLMSIQATPVVNGGLNADLGLSTTTTTVALSIGGVQSRARQSIAIVNVPQKFQQQPHASLNGIRPVLQQPQPQQRILTGSASSPSLFGHVSRNSAQPLPLFPSQFGGTTNAGLLPTPPGFNYSVQNATLNGSGLHPSQTAALALMQQFSLLQQHYQQALHGFQNPIPSSAVTHSNASLTHFNFSAVSSQSNTNQKHAHPSAFN
ncbi:hypothetical protein P879_09550 [Paragonimus westermani]|uniref:SUZ domain-containing protein n=1 Tax=Paragonimus westermani TaxID=34504 RepID=A0A8T0D4I3_9TREM|nr:hypothetical protein P879_09550 [Paragonimus westermani]